MGPSNGQGVHTNPITHEVEYDAVQLEAIRLVQRYQQEHHLRFMNLRQYLDCFLKAGWLTPPANLGTLPPLAAGEAVRLQEPPDRGPAKRYTTGEAAAFCGVTQQTVINWCRYGQLRAFQYARGKHRKILAEDLASFMRARGMEVPPELADAVAAPPAAQPAA